MDAAEAFTQAAYMAMMAPEDHQFALSFLLSYRIYKSKGSSLHKLWTKRWERLATKDKELQGRLSPYTRQLQSMADFLTVWIQSFPHDFRPKKVAALTAALRSHPIGGPVREILKMHSENNKETSMKSRTYLKYDMYEAGKEEQAKLLQQKIAKMRASLIARTLTNIETEMFQLISPAELLQYSSTSLNVARMIARFNEVSFWVGTALLKPEEDMQQAALIEKFIEVADKMLRYRNFNGLMQILAGLNLHAVSKLNAWKLVSRKSIQRKEELEAVVDPGFNYRAYREAREDAIREHGNHSNSTTDKKYSGVIPYMAVVQKDLLFIIEGNPKYLEDGSINMERARLLYKLISAIQQMQKWCGEGKTKAGGSGRMKESKEESELRDMLISLEGVRDQDELVEILDARKERSATILNNNSNKEPGMEALEKTNSDELRRSKSKDGSGIRISWRPRRSSNEKPESLTSSNSNLKEMAGKGEAGKGGGGKVKINTFFGGKKLAVRLEDGAPFTVFMQTVQGSRSPRSVELLMKEGADGGTGLHTFLYEKDGAKLLVRDENSFASFCKDVKASSSCRTIWLIGKI